MKPQTLYKNYIPSPFWGTLIAPNPTFCSTVNTSNPNPHPHLSWWSLFSSPPLHGGCHCHPFILVMVTVVIPSSLSWSPLHPLVHCHLLIIPILPVPTPIIVDHQHPLSPMPVIPLSGPGAGVIVLVHHRHNPVPWSWSWSLWLLCSLLSHHHCIVIALFSFLLALQQPSDLQASLQVPAAASIFVSFTSNPQLWELDTLSECCWQCQFISEGLGNLTNRGPP